MVRSAVGGAAVFCTVAALRCNRYDVLKNALGATINAISFVHYCSIEALRTTNTDGSHEHSSSDVISIRLADWSMTLPLLVLEIHLFMNSSIEDIVIGSALSFAMVFFGAWGCTAFSELSAENEEKTNSSGDRSKLFLLVLAWAYFGCTLFNFYCQFPLCNTAHEVIVLAFTAPWFLYGVVIMAYDRIDADTKNVCFNTLDVHSKAILAMTLAFYTLE